MIRKLKKIVLFTLFLVSSNLFSQSYIGEIRIFAGNFAPAGWEFCNGQLLSISENEFLFNLIGTIYGGDGQTNFALPDLRGRTPIHQGQGVGLSNRVLGEIGGEENVTLIGNQIPSHTHSLAYNEAKGSSNNPEGKYPSKNSIGIPQYGSSFSGYLNSESIESVGGNQSHNNMQPYNTCNYIISLYGIYPSMAKEEPLKYVNLDGSIVPYEGSKGIEPFVGEILIFPFDFAPRHFAHCNGQLLPINQNQALYSLLGTTYGGNGQTDFALPDLIGRAPINRSNNISLGSKGGSETHTLLTSELPSHSHSLRVSNQNGSDSDPSNNFLASNGNGINSYSDDYSSTNSLAVANNIGGTTAHNNMQPYLVLNFCIALSGIFPSHSKSDEVKGADPFVGEVNIFAFNFTPRDYQSCNGDLLSLSQNTALFSLVGTTYGGNGTSTFGIPDFTGRVVLHRGQGIGLTNRILGEKQGENYHTLTIAEIPSHNHQLKCSSENKSESLSGSQFSIYPNGYNNTSNVYINSGVVSSFGGNQGHNNMMPYLALNYCLATVGVFPPRP